MPGILAGLKERSQSAYAAPAPKPVDNAIGHVRPILEEYQIYVLRIGVCYELRKRMTDAMMPAPKPIPLNRK